MTASARGELLGRALRHAASELERDPLLLSGLAGGGWIEELEESFRAWLGAPHVLATSSATAALIAALRVLGVGPGDEIVLPSYCWIGCVGAIQVCGAVPVWADIEQDTFQVDPESVLEAMGPRTVAILAPHLAGYPCATEEIAAIARARGVALIEDGSQALGASVAGLPVGRWGDFAVFSFGTGKLIDAGEGGLLVTRTAALREKALLVASHPLRQAIDVRDTSLRSQIGGGSTLNFRIHPLAALLANAQVNGIAERLDSMACAHDRVRAWLEQCEAVRPAFLPDHHRPNGAMIPLRLDARSGGDARAARAALLHDSAREGIELVEGPIGRPCHLRSAVSARRSTPLPVTEQRCSGEELLARVDPEARKGIRGTAVATDDAGFHLVPMSHERATGSTAAMAPGTESALKSRQSTQSGCPAGGRRPWRS